jgi:hypothetical protein
MTEIFSPKSTAAERGKLSARELRRLAESENRHITKINGANFWGAVKIIIANQNRMALTKLLNDGLKKIRRHGVTVDEMLAHDNRQSTGRPKRIITDWEAEYRKRNPSRDAKKYR